MIKERKAKAIKRESRQGQDIVTRSDVKIKKRSNKKSSNKSETGRSDKKQQDDQKEK